MYHPGAYVIDFMTGLLRHVNIFCIMLPLYDPHHWSFSESKLNGLSLENRSLRGSLTGILSKGVTPKLEQKTYIYTSI